MASEWIKMREDLTDDLAVESVAAACKMDEYAVVGRLLKFWAWARRQTIDGFLPGANHAMINKRVHAKGFSEALANCGWLLVEPTGMRIPKWDNHNSDGAKARAVEARKKANQRVGKCPDANGIKAGQEGDAGGPNVPEPSGQGQVPEIDKSKNKNTAAAVSCDSPNTPPAAVRPSRAAAAEKTQRQPAAQTTSEITDALDDAGISNAKKRAQIAAADGVTAALIRKVAADGQASGKGPGAIAENILAEAPKAAKQAERNAKAKAALAEKEASQRAKDAEEKAKLQRKDAQFDAEFAELSAEEIENLWAVISAGGDRRWGSLVRAKFDATKPTHQVAVMTLKREVEDLERGAAA